MKTEYIIRALFCTEIIRTDLLLDKPLPPHTPFPEGNQPDPGADTELDLLASPSLSSQDGIYSLCPCAHQPPHPVSLPSLSELACCKAGKLGPEHPKNNGYQMTFQSQTIDSHKRKRCDGTGHFTADAALWPLLRRRPRFTDQH